MYIKCVVSGVSGMSDIGGSDVGGECRQPDGVVGPAGLLARAVSYMEVGCW